MIRKTVIAVLAFCVFATTAAFFASIKYHFGYWGEGGCVSVAQGMLGIGFGTPPFRGSTVPGWIWEGNYIVDTLIGLPRVYSSVGFPFIGIPLWLLFVLFATYPTIAFARGPLRRLRRRRKCLCLKCGYNLTGNTSGVCSECGTKIQP